MKGPMDMDKNCRVPLLITEEPNRQMTAPTMNENTSIEGEILLDIERHSDGWSQCSFTSTNALQEVGDREVNEVSCSNGVSYGDDYHHHQVDRHNPFSFLGVSPSFGAPTCSIDPFRNHTPNVSGLYEWIKTVICVPVALVRLLVFGLVLSIGFLATKLALVGWKDKHNPMPKSRCKIMWIPRIAARCILFCFGFHWIRRIGKPASRELAPIVVSNHVSYTDPIFFFYELFPSIVASETHDKIPVVGTIIRAMQVIYVDRFSSASRKRAVTEIKRKASCSDFPRVMLFPEGTTTNGRALISFQLGAFVPGFPIQPVVIRYPYVHFDPSWGKISLLKLMFRMLTQFHNFLEVEYLPVIFPTQSKKENPTTFARKVGYAMAKRLNVVQSEHSYGDLALASRASHIGLASTSDYMVEMAKMDRLFQLSAGEAIGFLDKFAAMEPDHRVNFMRERHGIEENLQRRVKVQPSYKEIQ